MSEEGWAPTGGLEAAGTTTKDYAEDCQACGFRVLEGDGRTLWLLHGRAAMVRFPTMCTARPTAGERRRVFWRGYAPLLSYIEAPSPGAPANAYLYVRERPYDHRELGKKVRQSLHRAFSELEISAVGWDVLRDKGFAAFRDTRARAGLSDGTLPVFLYNVDVFARTRGHTTFGAWRGDRLVAFLIFVDVDGMAEGVLSCSCNESLPWCPNNALFHTVFETYLGRRGCRVVSAGLSSIQPGERWVGLHRFKQHVGFEAIPVRRAMVLHPLARPLVNSLTLRGLRGLFRLAPKNPYLRKGVGAVSRVLGQETPMTSADGGQGEVG